MDWDWRRKAGTPQANQAISIAWFKPQGLISRFERYSEMLPQRKPPDTISTSGRVGERGP